MKNFLLTAAALTTLTLSANAQRMTLHEEFTGENCPPCASTNPGFWDLCNGSGNPSKLIHIAYMVPIPSAGFYCNRTTPIYTARDAYYSVPFAPYGRYDGKVPNATASSPGHPGFFTQADIDAEAAVPDSFSISMTAAWDATYANVITTVTVTCGTAWTGSGTTPNVVLHTALVKTDDFATSPGTNGETHFENVVQGMYPSVSGTAIAGTWAAGATMTYTITAAVPSWVDKSQSPFMVSWIQDNGNKHIAQAAKSAILTLAVDAGTAASPAKYCAAGASTSVTSTITLKNTGTNPLTSATIYYSYDGGTLANIAWTGPSLAAGATTTVSIPATTLTPGSHVLYDSVASPNGSADVNVVNNGSSTAITVLSTTPVALPLSNNFEAAMPANWLYYDENGNGKNWVTATAPEHTGGTGTKGAKHNNFVYSAGETNYVIMPTPTLTALSKLTFWVAYAQYAAENDQLDVVYSTDCGATWTSVFSKSGATLKTVPAQTSAFTPTAAQWRKETVDLATVPASALLAFKAISAYGNNLYIDDVSIADVPVSVAELPAASLSASIHPNPASDLATLTFSLEKATDVQVQVVDVTGRVISVAANGTMTAGKQDVKINTANLASGLYNVVIRTENGVFTQPLSVAK
jgi:hypothetical protein